MNNSLKLNYLRTNNLYMLYKINAVYIEFEDSFE